MLSPWMEKCVWIWMKRVNKCVIIFMNSMNGTNHSLVNLWIAFNKKWDTLSNNISKNRVPPQRKLFNRNCENYILFLNIRSLSKHLMNCDTWLNITNANQA